MMYDCKHTEATYKVERITDVFQKLFTLSETILKDYSMVEDGQKVMAAKDSNETPKDVSKLHKKISELEQEVKRKEERRSELTIVRERKNEEAEKKTQWKSPVSDPVKCNKFALKLFNSALNKIHVTDVTYREKGEPVEILTQSKETLEKMHALKTENERKLVGALQQHSLGCRICILLINRNPGAIPLPHLFINYDKPAYTSSYV